MMRKSDSAFRIAKEHFFIALDHISNQRWGEAEIELKISLECMPNRLSTLNNLCITLIKLKKFKEAKSLIGQMQELDPANPDSTLNQGLLFSQEENHYEALASYEKAIKLNPAYAEAWMNRGIALNALNRYGEALLSYEKSIKLKPDYAEAWINQGITLNKLGRHAEALISYEKSIELKSDFAESWINRGNALNNLKRYEEALECYKKAVELKVDTDYLLGDLVHVQMMICDWNGLENRRHALEEKLLGGSKAIAPFPILGLFDKPQLQMQGAKLYAKQELSVTSHDKVFSMVRKREKIRIGYYSSDFHNHATMYLISELFELHDRNKFEIFGFSFGPNNSDTMRLRAENGMDMFFDVNQLSDRSVALLSLEHEIDIAIDLKGYTQDSRPQIFAHRAAPIQISYLGYPGTSGTKLFDYLIADPVLISKDTQGEYSEKIIYLPNSYQVNVSNRKISDRLFTRKEFGLPLSRFVYCCFNNNWKILPEIFDCWMIILQLVDGSVLWLFEDNPSAVKNLRKEAASRSIDPNRLVFAKRISNAEHLVRYKLADLFLDTFPYNAHTTASDALWAGVPVLTLQGQSFAARVASSLLTNIGLPELITHSKEEYCSLAAELALNPNKLALINAKLAKNRFTSPLFNTKLFARHIELAYQAAYERYHSGLPPDHIYVSC